MEYKKYDYNSFNFYAIKTDKFKNCHLEIVFRSKALKEQIMPRKFLCEMLSYSNEIHNNQKDLSLHLEDLYNTSFYSLLSRVGKSLFSSFIFDFINPKYCEEGYLENVLKLVCDTILHPNIKKNAFDIDSFNIIKNSILTDIKTSKENAKSHSYRRLFELMDDKSYLSYNMLGTEEMVNEITPYNLVDTYKEMLKNDYCDIYLIGNLKMDKIANYFEKNFNLRYIKNYDLDLFYHVKPRNKVQIKKEYQNINQANLLVGCNVINLDNKQKDIIMYLYNFILGGGSLDTKLGTYLRQDNSLCYTVNSIYQKYDSALVIYAGIDPSNYEKAVSLIKKSLKEMTINITKEELENAKLSLITSLNMVYDNPSSLINNYLFRNIANLDDVESRIKNIKNVTIEDIKQVAKKVKINTIYMLSGVK